MLAEPLQAASASPMPEGVTDPNYHPAPGRLGNLTVTQLHTLEKLKKELKEEGTFVEERMNDAMLLRCVHLLDSIHFSSLLYRVLDSPSFPASFESRKITEGW